MWSIAFILSILASADSASPTTDTVGVLRAVVVRMRLDAASADAAREARCAAGMRPFCAARYPAPAVWHLEQHGTEGVRVAQLLADLDSVEFTSDRRLPTCPWPADAPRGSGYRVRADLEFVGDTSAIVTVLFRCDNPPGYLHDVYALDRTFHVRRDVSGWHARAGVIRVTERPAYDLQLPNEELKRTATLSSLVE